MADHLDGEQTKRAVKNLKMAVEGLEQQFLSMGDDFKAELEASQEAYRALDKLDDMLP